MQHLDNIVCYLAYGLGFATGNYFGIYLEQKMSLGAVVLRVIPKKDTSALINHLREANFGVSAVDIEGMTGKSQMLLMIIKRKHLNEVLEIIHSHNPNAFYTIEDVKSVSEGYFRNPQKNSIFPSFSLFHDFRKGK